MIGGPDLPRAIAVARATPAEDAVVLDYEGRLVRRRRLVSRGGLAFLVDLPQTVSLDPGDALVLEDGRRIGILAALEPCLRIEGALPRLAWHVGNRHAPCQIGPDHLLIRADPVLADMLHRLGARVTPTMAPFAPEGGAYGHGRTMGHSH
jgi:urease accessory protein